MFTVYRASGNKSGDAYYGYCQGEDPKAAFMVGARRSELERADVRLFMANGEDEANIKVEVLDACNDEVEAWMSRNDFRATSIDSMTAPTYWPGNMAERAAKEFPERVADWKNKMQQRDAKNAREAWALGMWTQEAVKALTTTHPRQQVVKDLDTMKPVDFARKYSLQ